MKQTLWYITCRASPFLIIIIGFFVVESRLIVCVFCKLLTVMHCTAYCLVF